MSIIPHGASGSNVNSADGSSDNTDASQYKILTLAFNQDSTYEILHNQLVKFLFKNILERCQWVL